MACICSPLPTISSVKSGISIKAYHNSSSSPNPSASCLNSSDAPASLRIRASSESRRPVSRTKATALGLSAPSIPTYDEVDSRVLEIHTREEFETAMENAKQKLVVVEYAASHSKNSAKIYPSLVNLSRQTLGVEFLLIMGDESEETAQLCQDAGVTNVPHFAFYKDGLKVHEEEGSNPDQLYSDVLYYGDSETPVKQLHGKEDLIGLIKEHTEDHKLVVIDMTLNNCGPCARVYPTVVKLSHQMEGNAVFARMIGDENDSCKEMMKAFKVVQVPTFLFIRDGKLSGKYVGSGRGELIGEVLRYQGVKCT